MIRPDYVWSDCADLASLSPTVAPKRATKAMPIEAGASYVFDLGYYDYGIKARYRTPCSLSAWAELDAASCRLVTRFKANTPLRTIEERAVARDDAIPCRVAS